MKIRISPDIFQKIPGIQIGVLVLKNLDNRRKKSVVEQLLRGVCAQKKAELKNEVKMKALNDKLSTLRLSEKESSKVLHEAQLMESDIRKITKGKGLEPKTNLYAVIHYLGLKNLVPVFARDLDIVDRDIELDFITPKKGKRPQDIELTPETRNLVVWFIDMGSQQKEDFPKLADEFVDVITKYCQGKKDESYLLNADMMEVDLGYESEKEKLYKEEEAKIAQNQESKEGGHESGEISEPSFLTDEPVTVHPEPLLREKLAQDILAAVNGWLTGQGSPEQLKEIDVETPNDPTHGDYSTNIAMKLGKQMEKTPREVADSIIAALKKPDYVEKIEIAGPGFINFHLAPEYLEENLNRTIRLGTNYGRLGFGAGQKAIIDYSSPNIAKPLGVHHLLSTIFGQTIAQLMRFSGYEVVSANYLGDWGTQFGKLLYAYKTWGNEEVVKKDPLNELLKLYVQFHNEVERDPALEDKGREEFKKLEQGDEENKRLWNWFRDLSIEELDRLYQKLGVKFDEYVPESMYLEAMKNVISEGKEKGIITEGEKGALIIKFPEDKYPPYMVQKADGTTLYATRDIASMRDRIERLHGTKLIYVVDVAQKLHFQQLFESAMMFGITGADCMHVSFGRMSMPEGRMSTRKGDVILLDEVIKEAIVRTKKIVEEKSQELAESERQHIAAQMAVSAIKYNIISQNPETNMTFDWDRILSLDGNSGPYLQYACARAKSILRKSQQEESQSRAPKKSVPKDSSQTSLFSLEQAEGAVGAKKVEEEAGTTPYSQPAEKMVLRLIAKFPEAVESATKNYRPNLLCNYLFELARVFSAFYNEVPVLSAGKPELKESRLKIVQGVAQVLSNGLKVLGIAVFERM